MFATDEDSEKRKGMPGGAVRGSGFRQGDGDESRRDGGFRQGDVDEPWRENGLKSSDAGSSRREHDFRPKAALRSKATAKADKPFIAQDIGSLNRLAGVSKGMPYQAPAPVNYGEGDRVSHVKYGLGTVTHLEKDTRDYKVTVEFDKAGQKIMYASFAKLKKIN